MARKGARDYVDRHRNVAVLAVSIFGLGLGEELWQAFLPVWLTSLGASGRVVGLFFSCRDLCDSLYQYPGGWLSDHLGRKKALALFTILAMAGYAVYALSVHWATAFLGLALAMGWKAGAFPATFAVIGDSLPKGKRVVAFSVQSILVRLPRVIGAPIGGLLIAWLGVLAGVRAALGITLILAVGVLWTQRKGYREIPDGAAAPVSLKAKQVFRSMDPALKRLLLADCLVRIGEGLATAFVALYVIRELGVSPKAFGVLYAIQQTVSIALYLPMGKLAEFTGRRPMVALTFVFFALFPLAVRMSLGLLPLVLAFIVGGLKEMGEPARKSLIVDLSDPAHRGRSVGVYYGIRNMLVVPAGAIGGILWQQSRTLPFEAAFTVGMVGVAAYLISSRGGSHEMGHA